MRCDDVWQIQMAFLSIGVLHNSIARLSRIGLKVAFEPRPLDTISRVPLGPTQTHKSHPDSASENIEHRHERVQSPIITMANWDYLPAELRIEILRAFCVDIIAGYEACLDTLSKVSIPGKTIVSGTSYAINHHRRFQNSRSALY
jgi:hypothetical protein